MARPAINKYMFFYSKWLQIYDSDNGCQAASKSTHCWKVCSNLITSSVNALKEALLFDE
jgi:hypothetical protein